MPCLVGQSMHLAATVHPCIVHQRIDVAVMVLDRLDGSRSLIPDRRHYIENLSRRRRALGGAQHTVTPCDQRNRWPASTATRAMAAPIPREAPVTTQTLPPDMHQSPKMRPRTPQTFEFIVGRVACLRLASLN